MNTSTSDALSPHCGGGGGGSSIPNNSHPGDEAARMLVGKTDVGTLDDVQFNASLDALLDGENLDEDTGSGSYQPNAVGPGLVGLGNSFVASLPAHLTHSGLPTQGLLTSSGSLGGPVSAATASTTGRTSTTAGGIVFPLPSVAYAVTTSNQPALPPGMNSYITNPYPSMPGATPHTSSTISTRPQQQPIMPSPQPPPPPLPPPVAPQAQPVAGAMAVAPGSSLVPPPPNSSASSKASRRKSDLSQDVASTTGKHDRDATTVSEDEEDRDRRRQDRNLREQQRSHKITQQIDHLRDVLAAANIQFKPDKYSTLVTVASYIKQLQAKSSMLDMEQKNLLDTISKTNDLVNNQYVPASTDGGDPPGSGNVEGTEASGVAADDADAVFVPNIDYRGVFSRCGIPLAVLSIDGRFLDCNEEFERLTLFKRDELLPLEKYTLVADEVPSVADPPATAAAPAPAAAAAAATAGNGGGGDQTGQADTTQPNTRNLSLFNLLHRECMEGVFMAMSEMLKHPPEKEPIVPKTTSKDYWTGNIYLSRNIEAKMQMNVSLVRSPQGRAKFFDCSLSPINEGP